LQRQSSILTHHLFLNNQKHKRKQKSWHFKFDTTASFYQQPLNPVNTTKNPCGLFLVAQGTEQTTCSVLGSLGLGVQRMDIGGEWRRKGERNREFKSLH